MNLVHAIDGKRCHLKLKAIVQSVVCHLLFLVVQGQCLLCCAAHTVNEALAGAMVQAPFCLVFSAATLQCRQIL